MRGKNEGSIWFDKSRSKWVATVSIDGGRRRSAYAPSRAEARTRLGELQRLKESNVAASRRLTLGQYLQRWLEDVRPNLAPATYKQHESNYRLHIGPTLGGVRLSDMSVAMVRQLFGSSLGPQSQRHVRATLRRALSDAQRDGLVIRNVAALAEPPKMTRKERPYLSADQVRTLIDGTREDRLWSLYVLACTTGMRVSEMLGLTWEDVNFGLRSRVGEDHLSGNGRGHDMPVVQEATDRPTGGHANLTVHYTLHRSPEGWQLREPKTPKSRRTIPLPAITVEALRARRDKQEFEREAVGDDVAGNALVFTTPRGNPLHKENLVEPLYAHEKRLGLPRVPWHGLRHSVASILIREGYPLPKIAEVLGHSTIRVTADLYGHLVPEDLVGAADIMERAVRG